MYNKLGLAIGAGLLLGCNLLGSSIALGDSANVVSSCGNINYSASVGLTVPLTIDINGNVCGSGSGSETITIPPKLTSYGILSVTSISVDLSALTVSPNSPPWTTTYPSNYVSIRNSVLSSSAVYVCWLGGTCSASVGDPIAIGQSATRNISSGVSPTLFSATTATITGQE